MILSFQLEVGTDSGWPIFKIKAESQKEAGTMQTLSTVKALAGLLICYFCVIFLSVSPETLNFKSVLLFIMHVTPKHIDT